MWYLHLASMAENLVGDRERQPAGKQRKAVVQDAGLTVVAGDVGGDGGAGKTKTMPTCAAADVDDGEVKTQTWPRVT